jgi:hypothetical protein
MGYGCFIRHLGWKEKDFLKQPETQWQEILGHPSKGTNHYGTAFIADIWQCPYFLLVHLYRFVLKELQNHLQTLNAVSVANFHMNSSILQKYTSQGYLTFNPYYRSLSIPRKA